MIVSWPSVALQKIVIPINFQHNLCTQYHLSKLKYHWLLNKSPSCQPVKLTVCEAIMLLYLLYLPREERETDLLEISICCRAEFLPPSNSHRWLGRKAARDTQQQAVWPAPATPSPVSCLWHQAEGSSWSFRDWWGKDTKEDASAFPPKPWPWELTQPFWLLLSLSLYLQRVLSLL